MIIYMLFVSPVKTRLLRKKKFFFLPFVITKSISHAVDKFVFILVAEHCVHSEILSPLRFLPSRSQSSEGLMEAFSAATEHVQKLVQEQKPTSQRASRGRGAYRRSGFRGCQRGATRGDYYGGPARNDSQRVPIRDFQRQPTPF